MRSGRTQNTMRGGQARRVPREPGRLTGRERERARERDKERRETERLTERERERKEGRRIQGIGAGEPCCATENF